MLMRPYVGWVSPWREMERLRREMNRTLRGSRQPEEVGEGVTFHRRERRFGSFTRTFRLPFDVDADKVEARFQNGVLSITLPRAEADKPKKIAVKTG